MHRAVLNRKKLVIKHIDEVRALGPANKSHERMCACYILAFGALEFMLETLIRGWIQSKIKKHSHPYPGKSDVETVIRALEQLAESSIRENHRIGYDSTCNLIYKLAGAEKKDYVKAHVDSMGGGSAALIKAIENIQTMRHNIAHGAFWPDETSPDLDALKSDFLTVYDGLIEAMDKALPRY